jgi:hypothetical protein
VLPVRHELDWTSYNPIGLHCLLRGQLYFFFTNTRIYIYIYTCVCVCVCFFFVTMREEVKTRMF